MQDEMPARIKTAPPATPLGAHAGGISRKGAAESKSALILGWICTPFFVIAALTTLCAWHPVILTSRRLASQGVHEWIIAFGNRILQACLTLTGGCISFTGEHNIPARGPIIVVSNHQSLFDIPLLVWLFRRQHAKFIAKTQLGKGIPSASYVLRTNGHALIDRGDAAQAASAIQKVAQAAKAIDGTVVIFPEGTRARDGVVKKFKPGGFSLLMRELPDATVLPVSIDGAWRIMRYKFLPVPFGIKIHCTIHPAVTHPHGATPQQTLEKCETMIREFITSAQQGCIEND